MSFLKEILAENSSFSALLPGLQTAVDSTSLGEFKICPRRYFYAIICGWQPVGEATHLQFGLLVHAARERFENARLKGAEHEEALRETIAWALRATWNRALAKPSFVGTPEKNRSTLVRSLVWYFDTFKDDPLVTLVLQGKPAVEVKFLFDSGFASFSTNEAIFMCGWLDRVCEFKDEPVISDIKTTSHALDAKWWSQFSPHNQFSQYILAGRVAFGLPVKKLIVDGLQVLVSGTRFQRGEVSRPDGVIDEWHSAADRWYKKMEICAYDAVEASSAEEAAESYEQNDKVCDLYGGCAFREVCKRSPLAREAWLKSNFTRRQWDPLRGRTEV